MTTEQKTELLHFLIFLRGMLQKFSLQLLIEGDDTTVVDDAEDRLAERIKKLRIAVMRDWQGDADALKDELKALNERAERKIRDLTEAQDRVAAVAEIAGMVDDALGLVAGILV